MKKQIKYLLIAILVLGGLYQTERFAKGLISFGKATPHPLTSLMFESPEKVTVKQGKALFDAGLTFHLTPVPNSVFIQREGAVLLRDVFSRKQDPETLFYYARTLILLSQIEAFTPREERVKRYQKGYRLLMDLAQNGYIPSQYYLGVITLEPYGLFSLASVVNLGLPRRVTGTDDGIRNTCKRLLFDKEYVYQWNVEHSNVEELKFLTSIYNGIMLDTYPRSNGYGITFNQAIDYLENAGEQGTVEAWGSLDRYFNVAVACAVPPRNIKTHDNSLKLLQSKSLMYKEKCKIFDNCDKSTFVNGFRHNG